MFMGYEINIEVKDGFDNVVTFEIDSELDAVEFVESVQKAIDNCAKLKGPVTVTELYISVDSFDLVVPNTYYDGFLAPYKDKPIDADEVIVLYDILDSMINEMEKARDAADALAYWTHCLDAGRTLTYKQYNERNAGEVPTPEDYAEELLDEIHFPETLRVFIDLERMGQSLLDECDMTQECPETGKRYFVNY